MFLYLIIFFFFLGVSFFVSKEGAKTCRSTLKLKGPILFVLLFVIVFMGTRYNVGIDYPNYVNSFKYTNADSFGEDTQYQYEYGFLAILTTLHYLDLGPQSMFFCFAILTIIPFFLLYKDNPRFLPLGIVVFFLCLPYEFTINGIRQGVSIFALLNALRFIKDDDKHKLRSLISFYAWIALGTLFHTSCLFFSILPLFLNKLKYSSLILFVVALSGFAINLLGLNHYIIPEDLNIVGNLYEGMTERTGDYYLIEKMEFRPIHFVVFTIYAIPLLLYNKIVALYPNVKYFYVFFSLGVFIFYLAPNNLYLRRIAYYFLFSEVIVYPAMTSYLLASAKELNKGDKQRLRSLLYYGINGIIYFWFFINFLSSIPNFFDLQVYPNASLLGITFK